MRRYLPFAAFLLFLLPALACGSTPTPTAKSGGAAPTATTRPSVAPSVAPVASTVGNASAAPSIAPKPSTSTAPASAPPAAATAHGLNELVSVKNWDMAVAGVERPGKDLVWSEFGNKSTAAGTWLVIDFDMKNTGNTNFGVNTPDFELQAAGGIVYKLSTDIGTYTYATYKKGQAIGGQVPPGVTVRYYLVFDIAPDATDLRLVFKQDTKPVFAVGNAAP
jgi:hypothetical protein